MSIEILPPVSCPVALTVCAEGGGRRDVREITFPEIYAAKLGASWYVSESGQLSGQVEIAEVTHTSASVVVVLVTTTSEQEGNPPYVQHTLHHFCR